MVEMNGQTEILCLTLGALAELEDQYEGKNILTLVDEFAKNGLGASDVLNVLHAGLIGAGSKISLADLNGVKFEGG
ncbi:MAG: gene transfer agent family protein, partial [Parvibaculaceae bacterium]|nr:gene transfer agent family protein [Parvibaculaceae bacterium]